MTENFHRWKWGCEYNSEDITDMRNCLEILCVAKTNQSEKKRNNALQHSTTIKRKREENYAEISGHLIYFYFWRITFLVRFDHNFHIHIYTKKYKTNRTKQFQTLISLGKGENKLWETELELMKSFSSRGIT